MLLGPRRRISIVSSRRAKRGPSRRGRLRRHGSARQARAGSTRSGAALHAGRIRHRSARSSGCPRSPARIVAPSIDLMLDSVALVVTSLVGSFAWLRFRERRYPFGVYQAAAFLGPRDQISPCRRRHHSPRPRRHALHGGARAGSALRLPRRTARCRNRAGGRRACGAAGSNGRPARAGPGSPDPGGHDRDRACRSGACVHAAPRGAGRRTGELARAACRHPARLLRSRSRARACCWRRSWSTRRVWRRDRVPSGLFVTVGLLLCGARARRSGRSPRGLTRAR